MNIIKKILKGLPSHPGTLFLFVIVLLGWAAAESWKGAAIILTLFGPVYLWGAYKCGQTLENEDV